MTTSRYTVQLHIAGYSAPSGRDVTHCVSLAEIHRLLLTEHETALRYGAGYDPSEALIWRGEWEDVTDQPPDMRATIGPRGGVNFTQC